MVYDDFVYDSELSANLGESVTSVLDKIKNYLGNFEYFYDEFGVFHFREVKNYLNTTQATTLVNDMKKNGIPPLYKGKIMTPFDDKVNKYGDPNIRQEMTDGFLKMLYSISETTIADLGIEQGEYDKGVDSFKKISGELRHQDHSYGVKEPLRNDDDAPSFY